MRSLRLYLYKLITILLHTLPRGKLKRRCQFFLAKIIGYVPLNLAITKEDIVMQIGATAGGDTFKMSGLVGLNGHVYVIEPSPENINKIRQKMYDKNTANITLIEKGAGKSMQKAVLYIHPSNPACSRLVINGVSHDRALNTGEYKETAEIDIDKLDNIMNDLNINKIDFLKITVMGAELEVINGMDKCFNQISQIWVKGHATINGRPINSEISAILREKGYKVMTTTDTITPDGLKRSGDVYAVR
jgi:FkbM family methyltransferase